MALDLSALSRQVRAMSGSLATEANDKQDRQDESCDRGRLPQDLDQI